MTALAVTALAALVKNPGGAAAAAAAHPATSAHSANRGEGEASGGRTLQAPPEFDPTSTLVSYEDKDCCGPRPCGACGTQADLDQCGSAGHSLRHYFVFNNYEVAATIDGCEYYSYQVYECITSGFDPSSTLVSYQDSGSCAPRGKDATADLSQ